MSPEEADVAWLQTEEALCLITRSARVTLAGLAPGLRSPMMVALGVVMAIARDVPQIADASNEPWNEQALGDLRLTLAHACQDYVQALMGPDVPPAFRQAFAE